jgi:hypothetical protein
MVNKGPKTETGKKRKLWTGDGRRRTPEEEYKKSVKDAKKAIYGASSGGKNKQAKKKK